MGRPKPGRNDEGTYSETIDIYAWSKKVWAQQRAKRIKNVKKTQDTFDKKWDQGRKREEEAERKENWKKEHKRLKKQRRLEKKYGIKLEDSLDQSKEELPWKIGPRILLGQNAVGKGETNDEWRERLGWIGAGNFKERYPLYESVGDPTQAVDEGEPPYPRYIWVWELGMWERKKWYIWDRKRRVRAFSRVTKLDGLYWSGNEAPTAAESRATANNPVRLAEEEAEAERQAAADEAEDEGKALPKTTQVQKPPLVLPEPSKGTRQSRRVMEKKAAELATEVPKPANQQTEGTGKADTAAKEKARADHVERPAQVEPTVQSIRGRRRSRARGGGNQSAAEKEPAKASQRGGARGATRGGIARGAKKANEPDETAPQPAVQGGSKGAKQAGAGRKRKADEAVETAPQIVPPPSPQEATRKPAATEKAKGGTRGGKQAGGGKCKTKADEAAEPPVEPVAQEDTIVAKKATGGSRKRKADETGEPAATGEPAPKKSRSRAKKGT